jgi:putative ABC transport system permease protein
MALGAVRTDILKMVVSQGMTPVSVGLVLGLALSAAAARVLTSSIFDAAILYGVSATDAVTFVGVTALLASVAVAACYLPALRAAQIDPIDALRYQ